MTKRKDRFWSARPVTTPHEFEREDVDTRYASATTRYKLADSVFMLVDTRTGRVEVHIIIGGLRARMPAANDDPFAS